MNGWWSRVEYLIIPVAPDGQPRYREIYECLPELILGGSPFRR